MQQVLTNKRPSFLQRSSSIASLVAWKEKYETFSGKFCKKATFKSYTEESDICKDTKLIKESLSKSEYNSGPENDLPPGYSEATMWEPPASPPPQPPERHPSFSQDFTALETYLKKKLSIRKKSGCRLQDTELETAKVFRWLHELPQGDNLEEFLDAYGIPTKGVDMEQLKQKLKVFLDERLTGTNAQSDIQMGEGKESRKTSSDSCLLETDTDSINLRLQEQMSSLQELACEDNLEKWIESLDVPYFKPIPETREQIRKFLKLQQQQARKSSDDFASDPPPYQVSEGPTIPISPTHEELIGAAAPKWKELIDKMRNVKSEEELEKWLASLEVPHNVPMEKVKAEIRKYFMHEEFHNFEGKSILLQEHTVAKELWEKFEDSSALKQVAMISGTTAALGLIAVLSTTMLSFAFPAAFAANPYFTEVFAQYFLQRQEVAFNLLNFHAQNAKPLSTAWAKQYILWKYC